MSDANLWLIGITLGFQIATIVALFQFWKRVQYPRQHQGRRP